MTAEIEQHAIKSEKDIQKALKKKEKKESKREREQDKSAPESDKNDGKKSKKVKKEKSEKSADSKHGDKCVSTYTKEQSAAWLKEHDIVITDDHQKDAAWGPICDFADTGLSKQVLNGTKKYSKPTPIQSVCWPILLGKRDIIGIAETGSGKTLVTQSLAV